jgi:5'-deoxynucleotidase YfbR-like HD superfamily hydrolase
MEQLDFIRNGGETRRFHTIPVLRHQTVAEHSFHVTMLLWTMYGQEEPGITIGLLMAGMTHDLAEHRVGDLPAPAKRKMEDYLELKGVETFRSAWGRMEQDILREQELDWEHALTADELRKLKLADAMEGALYCIRERAMGNTLIVPCFLNFRTYISDEISEHAGELDVFNYITTQWELVNEG